MRGKPPVLTIENVSVRFGGLLAVDAVDLEVCEGEIVGLIGPNGAGKTTFVDAITGFVDATGTITLEGRDLTALRAHERARSGLGRTWQHAALFDDLSVKDNVEVARTYFTARRAIASMVGRRSGTEHEAARVLDRFDLASLEHRPARELTTGQRRLVGFARALNNAPHVLCMDEPAAGLDESERAQLGAHLRGIVDEGVSILLIDHDMPFVMGLCDYVYVLDSGRLIAHGAPREIVENPAVIEAYLGSTHRQDDGSVAVDLVSITEIADAATAGSSAEPLGADELSDDEPAGDALLRIDGLTAGYGVVEVIDGLSLSVHTGEVVALFGPNGAGKTTTLLTISGLLPPIRGSIELFGQPMGSQTATERALLGLGHVPEDRSLFFDLTVEENLMLGCRGADRDLSMAYELFPALAPLRRRKAGLLSGGEQQMLTIGRALLGKPRVLIVDELSLGLAPIVTEKLLATMRRIADEAGCGVLLVEQHVNLALTVADHGCAVAHGKVLMSGPADVLRSRLSELAAGYLSSAEAVG